MASQSGRYVMRHAYVAVFAHLVWTTWDRLPLLSATIAREAYRAISHKCANLGATVIAIGGVEDHVHLLVQLPATVSIAELVGQAKGASAHLLTRHVAHGEFFRWQGSYAAFSVSPGAVSAVRQYIESQREHHAMGDVIGDWEPRATGG